MTSTVFTDFVTPVPASWLNDVNTSTYTTVPAEIARATAAENARPTSATLAATGGAALIGNTPAGNIAATNVQAALNELDVEKALLAGSGTQVFSAANATPATQNVVPISQADARYAALAGLSTQLFSVAAATATTHAIRLDQINAGTGAIGEYFSSEIAAGTPVSVPASTNTVTVTTLNLGIGTWDVSALAATTVAGTTTTSMVAAHIDTSASTYSIPNGGGVNLNLDPHSAGTNVVLPIINKRLILAAPGTVYLRCRVDFATSTAAVYGGLYARRASL